MGLWLCFRVNGDGRQNFYLNEYQTPFGKRTFQAKVTKSFSDGYTIETIIDGKPLRGVLFSNKPSSINVGADTSNRKMEAMKSDGANVHGNQNSGVESEKSMKHHENDVRQADSFQKEKELADAQVEAAASEMKSSAASESSIPQEQVPEVSEPPMPADVNAASNATNNPSSSNAETHKENVSAVVKDQNTSN
ncbi:UNVERIFIED_CONTAM: hypothetical protein Slati_3216900 [Sesamum latifolium]|uniref:Uncharacterized protein n=1 Tax=Sesamum latifolium TaxID=2727402 RepID=A0AAW2UYC1_9LAMI